MRKSIILTLCLLAILLFNVDSSAAALGVNASDAKVGEHFKTIPAADGTNEITFIQNGLNYKDANGNWIESKPDVQSFSSGIVCSGASYRVILATNLNSYGSVDLELPADPDTGQRGRIISHPLGIGFYDPDSGDSVSLAQLQDCSAQIVSSKIIFADAFAANSNGIQGSIIYTYGIGHFHQDVTLTAKPSVTPADFGMGENARIEVLTEIVQSSEPVITEKNVSVATSSAMSAAQPRPESVATDQTLDYGTMQMGTGRAFATSSTQTASPQNGLTVTKQLVSIGNRTVLTEDVPWNQAAEVLQTLPQQSRSTNTVRQASKQRALPRAKMIAQLHTPSPRPSGERAGVRGAELENKNASSSRPSPPAAEKEKQFKTFAERLAEIHRSPPLKLASLNHQPSTINSTSGFVMDYELVQSCYSFSFQSGHTYWINSIVDIAYVTIESGAVIKYAGGSLRPYYEINCPDSGPKAVLTDINDDSVGFTDPNSAHHYTGCHADVALDLSQLQAYSGANVHNLDLRFVVTGIIVPQDEGSWCYVSGCWFFKCSQGVLDEDDLGDSCVFGSDFCEVDYPYPEDLYAYGNTTCSADRNANGLPDAWEMDNFGSLNQTANGDYDGDGLTNLWEYNMGTNPAVSENGTSGVAGLQVFTILE
jgi:hypothetical protein